MTPGEPTHRSFSADHLVSAVEKIVSERIRAALAAYEVDLEEWRVLSLLADGEGHTMAETAEFALLPPPTLTKVVNRLVANNLVHRRTGTVDRRQVLIRNTARGMQKHEDAADSVRSAQDSLFGSEAERQSFENVLSATLDNAVAVPLDH